MTRILATVFDTRASQYARHRVPVRVTIEGGRIVVDARFTRLEPLIMLHPVEVIPEDPPLELLRPPRPYPWTRAQLLIRDPDRYTFIQLRHADAVAVRDACIAAGFRLTERQLAAFWLVNTVALQTCLLRRGEVSRSAPVVSLDLYRRRGLEIWGHALAGPPPFSKWRLVGAKGVLILHRESGDSPKFAHTDPVVVVVGPERRFPWTATYLQLVDDKHYALFEVANWRARSLIDQLTNCGFEVDRRPLPSRATVDLRSVERHLAKAGALDGLTRL